MSKKIFSISAELTACHEWHLLTFSLPPTNRQKSAPKKSVPDEVSSLTLNTNM